jgi:hypothetical protein
MIIPFRMIQRAKNEIRKTSSLQNFSNTRNQRHRVFHNLTFIYCKKLEKLNLLICTYMSLYINCLNSMLSTRSLKETYFYEDLSFVKTWVELEITICEISHVQKNKYCMISLVCGCKKVIS